MIHRRIKRHQQCFIYYIKSAALYESSYSTVSVVIFVTELFFTAFTSIVNN